jgi:hypothetical protein
MKLTEALRQRVDEARAALGDGAAVRLKLHRAWKTLLAFRDRAGARQRLERLEELGLLEEIPNDWQLAVGSYRMLFEFLIPSSEFLYADAGKDFWWQQVLRVLDEPSAVMDPTGLYASQEAIISHLIQVTHFEAAYDVALLHMFPGGLDALEEELRQLVAGTHPRQEALDAIVERPEYHEKLLEAVVRYRADPHEHWRCSTVPTPPNSGEVFAFGENFLTPGRFFEFCSKQPASPLASLRARLAPRAA